MTPPAGPPTPAAPAPQATETYRYAEDGTGRYTLMQLDTGHPVSSIHGFLESRPEWLVKVLAMAKLGGYGPENLHTGDAWVVWFSVTVSDGVRNLKEFNASMGPWNSTT